MCTQPCYFGGPFALNWASDEDDHLDIGEKKLAKRQEKRGITTRYWTPAVHNAAFALPAYAKLVADKARTEGKAEKSSRNNRRGKNGKVKGHQGREPGLTRGSGRTRPSAARDLSLWER